MPLDVSQIADEVKPLDIPLGGGVLHVEYYPGRLTRKTDRLIRDKAKAFDARQSERRAAGTPDPDDDDEGFSANAELLCVALASWDLVNRGKPVPVAAAAFTEHLGHLNTVKIIRALYADRDLPNETR